MASRSPRTWTPLRRRRCLRHTPSSAAPTSPSSRQQKWRCAPSRAGSCGAGLTLRPARWQVVNQFSLLLTLQGTDPLLDAALVMCHLDVASVEPGTEGAWGAQARCGDCSPFSGKISDGEVWGRGALDMKAYCVAVLHATDALMRRPRGFAPARTLLLALGHDEEKGGEDGHGALAARLRARGVRLAALLDEGTPILAAGNPFWVDRHLRVLA